MLKIRMPNGNEAMIENKDYVDFLNCEVVEEYDDNDETEVETEE